MSHNIKIKTSQLGPDGEIVEIEREPTQEEINEIEAILENETNKRNELYEAFKNIKSIKSLQKKVQL